MAYDETHDYEHHYYPSIEARKLANAANTKRKNWLASDERAAEIIEFVSGYEASNDGIGFFNAVNYGIQTYGKPTDNMRDKMVSILDKRAAQAAKWAEQDAKCAWVGNVGKRQSFTVIVMHIVELETMYGFSYINICRDADNNVVIYKGTQKWKKGSQIDCVATVKAHDIRDGVKQTVIQRPSKVMLDGEDY
ncbi:MAG: hypothetical protein Unbinned4497contig1000_3 [Prokaryotic dsDNA virus sp.]|nr:MAG: hypothetical protein Unbinned4497contig1000_3 [Prokaryotic dsDNA virus sp.]